MDQINTEIAIVNLIFKLKNELGEVFLAHFFNGFLRSQGTN